MDSVTLRDKVEWQTSTEKLFWAGYPNLIVGFKSTFPSKEISPKLWVDLTVKIFIFTTEWLTSGKGLY